MIKKISIWVLALVITLMAAIYQRTTGPTYPRNYEIKIGDDIYKGELLRTQSIGKVKECLIEVPVDDKDVTGYLFYRKFKSNEKYQSAQLTSNKGELCGVLPTQPAAGKLQYYIELVKNGKTYAIAKDDPVVIRFRNDVPGYILLPHVLLMFISMFFSTLCGLYILFKQSTYPAYVRWTFWTLVIGGFLFGPLMQKFAFGEFWTGIPFGFDLTDNKTLFVFCFWLWAFLANRKKLSPVSVLVACVMTLVIFSIPHSLMGSEFNYATHKVQTGWMVLTGW